MLGVNVRGAILLGWIAGMLAMPGCGRQEEAPAVEPVRPVKMVRYGEATGDRTFNYPGKVFPNTTVEVAFEVSGRLAELPVAKGQKVSEGDLLGRLDPRDFRNQLAAATASLDEARATLGRYEEAAKTNAVSPRDVDQARSRARIAEAEVSIRRKALEDTEVRADFDGVIADRYVENFQNIQAKSPILSLQDLSTLEVRVDIPERDAAGSEDDEIGTLTATFDAFPGRQFDLELKEFVTRADPITQTFPVTLSMVPPDDVDILPGMTATVTWNPPLPPGGALQTLPAVAVLGQQGRGAWVWVVDPDSMRVAGRRVTVGSLVYDGQIQITGGLEAGELVAAAGAHHLSEGMQVSEFLP